jgi:hypothetical protein
MGMMHHGLHHRLTLEDEMTGQKPVAETADGIEIGPSIERTIPEHLLGCHEGRRPAGGSLSRKPEVRVFRLSLSLDETKIENFDEVHLPAVPTHINIRRFDVAVYESRLVSLSEGVTNLSENVDHSGRWDWAESPNERLGIHPVK